MAPDLVMSKPVLLNFFQYLIGSFWSKFLRRMPFLHNSVENLADIKAETLTSEVTHQDPVYPTTLSSVYLMMC